MSDLRVALVAEGPIDAIVIEAALRALLPRPFVLTTLQPEPTRPCMGNGWGGVLAWCLEFASRGHPRIDDDPTLQGFDLFVIHLDADVAESAYADVSPRVGEIAVERQWPVLPEQINCPPAEGSVDAVRTRVLAWAGLQALGPKAVLCVPSKASGAWLAAAVLDAGHGLLERLECNLRLDAQLSALPLAERIKKTTREYRARATRISEAWPAVRQRCSQAERFSNEVAAVIS